MTYQRTNQFARWRIRKGLSQDQLAERLRIKRQTVSAWERGVAAPRATLWVGLRTVLGVSLDQIASACRLASTRRLSQLAQSKSTRDSAGAPSPAGPVGFLSSSPAAVSKFNQE